MTAYYGDNASIQPGTLQEVMLHETAVSWIRYRERTRRPATPWTETYADFGTRLRSICQEINNTLDVEDLCRALPARAQAVVDAEGRRIDN